MINSIRSNVASPTPLPAPQQQPPPSFLDQVDSHSGFVGSAVGSLVGLGFAYATHGLSAHTMLCDSIWGSLGGLLVGWVVGKNDKAVPMTGFLGALNKHAPLLGGLAGVGIGIACAATPGLAGNALFNSAIWGGLGGSLVGYCVQE